MYFLNRTAAPTFMSPSIIFSPFQKELWPATRTSSSSCPDGETLESVSSCTRFSGFLTISSFDFNRLSSKLVGMFFRIVPMFVLKDFVRDCFIAQICAKMCLRAGICA